MTEEEVTSRWEGIIESPELKLSCQVYEIASCAGLWGRNLQNLFRWLMLKDGVCHRTWASGPGVYIDHRWQPFLQLNYR